MSLVHVTVKPDAEVIVSNGHADGAFVDHQVDRNGFLGKVESLFESLEGLKVLLRERQTEEFIDESRRIVEECDTLLAACFVFIDFIHPVWIRYSQ
jgi:hypothetical protein